MDFNLYTVGIQSARKQKSKPVTSGGPGALTSDTGQLDAIALRDETVRLKQLLNAAMKERDLGKAQQVKLQQDVGRKDKQIQDLLAAGHITVSIVFVIIIYDVLYSRSQKKVPVTQALHAR